MSTMNMDLITTKCDEERFEASKDAVRSEDDPAVSPLKLLYG